MTHPVHRAPRFQILLILLCHMGLAGNCLAQDQGEPTNTTRCVERLEMPEYPPLPRQARVQGKQTVSVVLAERGSVVRINSDFHTPAGRSNTYFNAAAEKAIRTSRFSPNCAGKTVTVVFHYELDEVGAERSGFAYGYPNHFWIRLGPQTVMPAVKTGNARRRSLNLLSKE